MKLPNYNYHSHTYRCGHAAFVGDLEYINKYINNGFESIGISDHMPNTKYQLPDERSRMDIKHLKTYLKSIKRIKKQNKNINILIGFECEYSNILGKHLCMLKDKCDYLILGQHYIDDINPISNAEYPLIYARTVCEALDTGLFDYIAHPDYFLKFRDTIKEEYKETYINNCKKCFKMICLKAKNLDIPIEINLNFINNIKIMKDNEYPYPHSLLFNIASKIGNKCVVGIDAHIPSVIDKYNDSFNKVLRDLPKLNIIYDYNPKNQRNKLLDKKYNIFKKSIKNFEHYYLKKIIKRIPYNSNNEEILKIFNKLKSNLLNSKNKTINRLLKEIDTINNSILDLKDKNNMINRKKEFIKITEKRYKEQNKLLNNMINKINKNKDKYNGQKLLKKLKEYYL